MSGSEKTRAGVTLCRLSLVVGFVVGVGKRFLVAPFDVPGIDSMIPGNDVDSTSGGQSQCLVRIQ